MFWWSVPVGLTGFLVSAICVVVGLVLVGFVYDFDPDDMGKVGTVLKTILYIGLTAMVVGFFFWALGSIWSPYV